MNKISYKSRNGRQMLKKWFELTKNMWMVFIENERDGWDMFDVILYCKHEPLKPCMFYKDKWKHGHWCGCSLTKH